jgi:hypothetical protein
MYQDWFQFDQSQYWLFVGIVAIGIIIGSVVPLGILLAMMCGIYMALFHTRRGQPTSLASFQRV